jgi:hypothetical protein
MGAGEQRQLVDRHRPQVAAPDGEGDRRRPAREQLRKDVAQGGDVLAAGKGQRAGERGHGPRARGDDEGVVGELSAAGGQRGADGGADADHRVVNVLDVLVDEDLVEGEGPGLAAAIEQLGPGGDQGDRHVIPSELAQREHRLERRHAAAGDEHPHPFAVLVSVAVCACHRCLRFMSRRRP